MKLENVVMDENKTLKLVDFGSASQFSPRDPIVHAGKLRGTPISLAPECWLDSYSTAADIWAVGIMLCKMLFFDTPYSAKTRDELKAQVLSGLEDGAISHRSQLHRLYRHPFTFHSFAYRSVSDDCKDFLERALEPNHAKRISAADALHHPWITKRTAVRTQRTT